MRKGSDNYIVILILLLLQLIKKVSDENIGGL